MITRTEILHNIITSILQGEAKSVQESINLGLKMGMSAEEIVQEAFLPATTKITDKFQGAEFFIADVIFSSHAIEAGLSALKPHINHKVKNPPKIVIGTVEGDLHDIGKNIVAISLGLVGFQIIDLGVSVSAEAFLEAVKQHQPDILAMSALLTTTMGELDKVIATLEKNHLRKSVKVMVGGGPVTREFAKLIGADGYAPSARKAIKLAQDLLQNKDPKKTS